MKNIKNMILSITVISTTIFTSTVFASNSYQNIADLPNASDVPKVSLNGDPLNFSTNPVIIDGTTYVPIRKIAECLGSTVTFESTTKNTLVEIDGKVLNFNKKDDSNYWIAEKTVKLVFSQSE